MASDFDGAGFEDEINVERGVNKRKRMGKMNDFMKRLRASTHELGDDCHCSRHRCFRTIPGDERLRIVSDFNLLGDYNDQNRYLSDLVAVVPVQRRRCRKTPRELSSRCSYTYRVQARLDGSFRDVAVCHKAFMSLHGISNSRVQNIKRHLVAFGEVRADGRGRHGNRPKKLSAETKSMAMHFLESLSDGDCQRSSKVCLPAEMSVAKLHRMYNDCHGENRLSYTTFREIVEANFDVSFGSPETDDAPGSSVTREKTNEESVN